MICPSCGKEAPEHAESCPHCGEELHAPGPPPRLLGQIQGLLPAEPVITSGRLIDPTHVVPLQALPTADQVAAPDPQNQPATTTPATNGIGAGAPLQTPPAATSPTTPHALPQQDAPGHWMIASLFFLVIAFGVLWHTGGTGGAPVRPAVKNAYAFIEILPSDARVLISWDYDPATQGELQLLAQPLLLHLQQKKVRMTFVSLRPFGVNVAYDTLVGAFYQQEHTVMAAPPPARLGFIPGEGIALRSLALSPIQTSSAPRISALSMAMEPDMDVAAFDLIIQFSADMASSRDWVEQVSTQWQTPLIVAASGAVAPMLRPYEQTGQIRVLLAGYPDALAYEQLLGQRGPATRQATSQTLALLLFLGIVSFAALRSLL